MKKHSKIIIVAILLTALLCIPFIYNSLVNRSYPKVGELKEIKTSKNKENKIEIYEQTGNATVGVYTRVYVKDGFLKTLDKLIYLERKPYNKDLVKWKNNNTIVVDGKELDIRKDRSVLEESTP